MTGPVEFKQDGTGVDALLTRWAQADREPTIAPGAALAAADRALATVRLEAMAVPANDRRWAPAAMFGGGVAAAIAGALFISGASPFGAGTPVDSAIEKSSPASTSTQVASIETPAVNVGPAPLALAAADDTPVQGAPVAPAAPERTSVAQAPIALATAETSAMPEAPFGAARRLPAGARLATADMEGFDFTEANDDLLMTGYVFTPRPDEEFLLP